MTEPTDGLQQRCAEIVEWQRTGVLPGDALRDYAAAKWAGHTDALQMAERDTSAQAMEWIAKWGTPPAVAGEPVEWIGASSHHLLQQPTQAQAGAAPLTEEQRQAIYDEHCYLGDSGWEVNWSDVIDAVEAAHGISARSSDKGT